MLGSITSFRWCTTAGHKGAEGPARGRGRRRPPVAADAGSQLWPGDFPWPGERRLPAVYQPRGAGAGRVHRLQGLRFPPGMPPREVGVWTPPGYERLAAAGHRFPVVYCQDGQNLMDAGTSWLGHDWRLGAAACECIEAGEIAAPLFVLISNVASLGPLNLRYLEYAHSPLGAAYLDWVCEEVRAAVEAQFAVAPGPASTAALGSSLGGLVSFLAVWQRPDVFGSAACLSPMFQPDVLAEVALQGGWGAGERCGAARVYLDNGGDTAAARVPLVDPADGPLPGYWWLDTQLQPGVDAMLQVLQWQGLELGGRRLQYVRVPGARHNERAWAARLGTPLRFLLAPQPPEPPV